MDLKHYFRKLREIEATIAEENTFIVSLETSDGGKAGIVTEVARELAAKLIAEGRAVLASKEERESFLQKNETARLASEQAEMARRVQVTVVSDSQATRPSTHSIQHSNNSKR